MLYSASSSNIYLGRSALSIIKLSPFSPPFQILNWNFSLAQTSRVISTIWGQHAEYEVRVKAGSRRWICWHRFSRFKLFAATIAEVNHSCAKAWGRVVTFQPPRRCLDQEYLANKCSLLEEVSENMIMRAYGCGCKS